MAQHSTAGTSIHARTKFSTCNFDDIVMLSMYFVAICGLSVHHFGPDRNISTTIGWIGVIFGTNVHGSTTMDPNDFGDLSSSSTIGLTLVLKGRSQQER